EPHAGSVNMILLRYITPSTSRHSTLSLHDALPISERLGFRYLDTGAMYRALTWLALQQGVPLGESAPLGELARRHPITFDEAGRVFIAGKDVTAAIRQARVDRVVSVVARHPQVREVMRERQRELA